MSEPATATEKPLRAYCVSQSSGENVTIVFALSAVTARREGANELDTEFGYVSCRRAHWADRYASDGRVPASACVEHGWWFEECCGCGRRISEDELAERRLEARGVIGWQGGAVFCCKTCKAKHDRRKRRQDRVGKELLAFMRAKVLRRFPGVKFVVDWPNEHVYVTEQQGFDVVGQVVVSFDFPGRKYGLASLRWDANPHHMTSWGGRKVPFGPPAPEYLCSNGDMEAFEAFASVSARSAFPATRPCARAKSEDGDGPWSNHPRL